MQLLASYVTRCKLHAFEQVLNRSLTMSHSSEDFELLFISSECHASHCMNTWLKLYSTLIPELLDIMAEVFYLIHGLYIVMTNNGK